MNAIVTGLAVLLLVTTLQWFHRATRFVERLLCIFALVMCTVIIGVGLSS